VPIVLGAALLAAGCAGPRAGRLGVLPNGERLVTVVVSQDREVVERECDRPLAAGPVLGCQKSAPVALPGGASARSVTIVRYADVLPSPMAFKIEVHELCHAVAALQALADPCHAGHAGLMELTRRLP
jgi:hypothetical protein